MDASQIQAVLVFAMPVLFAITLHEAAHGYAARHFGDNTAYMMGRISLNPIRHIDPIGTILMPLLLYFATSGAFLFGYAKPVPVNFGRLRDPRWHGMWVALAGPGINFAMALGWGLLAIALSLGGLQEPFFFQMVQAGVLVNLVMCAFNLFPLPPLDGGRVLVSLLPIGPARLLARTERYGFFIVMALILLGAVTKIWMRPVMYGLNLAIELILSPLY
ncbi:MAG: site-2 protease family protein [Candidatus Protistobacter heckmanni]|nr:site-2 protease family protein [Candidatus Protistobacter heckmanni]